MTTQLIPFKETGLVAHAEQHDIELRSTERKMLMAASRKQVRDYTTQELVDELKAFIPALCRDLGMQRTPDQYDQTRFFQTLTDHYADLTLSDVKVAFEMHMLGELDGHYGDRKPHHYQMFSFEFYTAVLRAYRQALKELQVRVTQDINANIRLLEQREVNPGIGKLALVHLVREATKEYFVSGNWEVLISPPVARMLQRLGLVEEDMPAFTNWDLGEAVRSLTRRMTPVVQQAERRKLQDGEVSEEVKSRAAVVQMRRMAIARMDGLGWPELECRFNDLEQLVVTRYKMTDHEKEQALATFSPIEGEEATPVPHGTEANADEAEAP